MQPVHIQKVNSDNTYTVKTEPPQTQIVKHPSDPNIGSILIPDEGADITNMYCSFCGMGIEMTDDLLNDLIVAQNKQVMELLRQRINAHFAEARKNQKIVGVQCELVGKPIKRNKPTE